MYVRLFFASLHEATLVVEIKFRPRYDSGMGPLPFTQKTYPLGADQAINCDKALALADSIEDEELICKVHREPNED